MNNRKVDDAVKLQDKLIAISREIIKNPLSNSLYKLKQDFDIVFSELYSLSKTNNFFWIFCSFRVYELNFEKRMSDFLTMYSSANGEDFIEFEIENINNSYKNGSLYFFWEILLNWDFSGSHFGRGKKNINVELPLEFLDYDLTQEVKINQKKKLKFLTKRLYRLQNDFEKLPQSNTNANNDKDLQDYTYKRIFTNKNAVLIFKQLKEELVRDRYPLADFSFIYRKMWEDRLIHQGVKEKEFRDWLHEKFEIEIIEPLKTIDNCETQQKTNLYSRIINSIRIEISKK